MNSSWPKVLAAVFVGMLVVGALFWFTSRSGAAAAGDDIVYVCSESGRVVVAPPQATPVINPETGRPTLLRGVYCPKCSRWYTSPSSEHLVGNPKALTCRIHKVPMTTDGPLPTADETK